MSSKEWSELRETFAACAPKAIAATTAVVMAVDPATDLGGADRFHGLTKEPTDAGKARDRITDALEHRYGYFGMTNLAAVPVAGTVDDCAAGLHEVAEAGAQLILLNPLFDELNQMRRLATEIIPRLA